MQATVDPLQAFPGQSVMKAENAELGWLRKEDAKLRRKRANVPAASPTRAGLAQRDGGAFIEVTRGPREVAASNAD